MATEVLEKKNRNAAIRELNKEARKIGCSVTEEKTSESFIRGLKFKIGTLLDVGVHSGTPYLYAAFKDTPIALFDPSPVSRDRVAAKYPALADDFNLVALGDSPGTLSLSLLEGGSSLMEGSVRPLADDPRYAGTIEVPVETLDAVIERKGYKGPFGLKVDVEGYELKVLQGASRTLADCAFVIAEVSVRRRFKDSYNVSEIVGLMAEHGFELLAVLNDKAGLQLFYDMLFVKRDHPLVVNEKVKAK